MAKTEAKSFVLQKQAVDSSRQPLEVYHLSHDLRGPLNSIMGFTELLIEGIEGPINEIQTEDLAAIYQSAQTLLRLINTVVDLSKLEADRLFLNFGQVELNKVIENILTFRLKSNELIGVKVVAEAPESRPLLWGDNERVEQMVFDLIKFAGKVKDVREIKLSVTHNKSDATIQITAVGGLIPPEQLESLFELAVEVDNNGRTHLGRGGLEMPMIQKLTKAHQGQVWVESQAEVGTTFYLRLPLFRPDQVS